jgi:prepilin signal peptidase PulO-like enzyme (type II secretory pathway)
MSFDTLIFIMITSIILVTAIIDGYYKIIHDLSWVSLVLMKLISSSFIWVVYDYLCSCIILMFMNMLTDSIGNRKMFQEGDLYFISALTTWIGLNNLDLLLGLSSITMVVTAYVMRLKKETMPMAPFLCISFFMIVTSTKECRLPESNWRPTAYETVALPTELNRLVHIIIPKK